MDERPQMQKVEPQVVPFTWFVKQVGMQPLSTGESVPMLRIEIQTWLGVTVLHLLGPDAHALAADLDRIASGGLSIVKDLPPDPFGRGT